MCQTTRPLFWKVSIRLAFLRLTASSARSPLIDITQNYISMSSMWTKDINEATKSIRWWNICAVRRRRWKGRTSVEQTLLCLKTRQKQNENISNIRFLFPIFLSPEHSILIRLKSTSRDLRGEAYGKLCVICEKCWVPVFFRPFGTSNFHFAWELGSSFH